MKKLKSMQGKKADTKTVFLSWIVSFPPKSSERVPDNLQRRFETSLHQKGLVCHHTKLLDGFPIEIETQISYSQIHL